MRETDRAERNNHEDDEAAVNPKQAAQQSGKSGEMTPPFEHARRESARNEDSKVHESAELDEGFHSAPMACMNGRITRRTKGGWKSQNAGAATTSIVKNQP